MKVYKATINQSSYKGPTNLILCANSWDEAWDLIGKAANRYDDSWNLFLIEGLSTNLTEAQIIVEF